MKVDTNLKPSTNDNGMALLLVVAVIAVLSVAVIGFNDRTQSSMEQAYYFQDKVRLQAMAESGIDIGCSVLYSDRLVNDHDSLIEDWAGLSDLQLDRLFGQGRLQVEISDLSGRFSINSLALTDDSDSKNSTLSELFRQMLVRLLMNDQFGLQDEIEAMIIADSLTDWLDSDDEVLPYGVENSYYLAQQTPYIARNGPVEFIDELLQVRGMTEQILYGNDEKRGLSEYISIYGTGRININTAPPLVFQALAPDISEEDVKIADDFRTNKDSRPLLEKPDWYQSVLGWPQDIVIDPSLITTRSSFFRVSVAAGFRTHTMQMMADVGRDTEEMSVYYRSMN